MPVIQHSLTEELVAEARQAQQQTRAVVDQLTDMQEEIARTMRHLRWWRYFGYDLTALEFLKHLDTGPEPRSSDRT